MFKVKNGLCLLVIVFILSIQACGLTPASNTSSSETEKNTDQSSEAVSPEGSSALTESIPVTITTPEGVSVVETAALWVQRPDEPELHTLYAAMALKSTQATLGFLMDYQVWSAKDKGQTLDTKTNSRVWFTIPAQQTGASLFNFGDYPVWMKPEKIEIQLKAGDYFSDRTADLELLDNLTYPNPFFTVNSATLAATPGADGNSYSVTGSGQMLNNLPVEAGAAGVFFFYNAGGVVVGLSTTLCNDSKSYACNGLLAVKIPPMAEGKLDTILPYPVSVEPAKVTLYPSVDVYFAQYLKKIE